MIEATVGMEDVIGPLERLCMVGAGAGEDGQGRADGFEVDEVSGRSDSSKVVRESGRDVGTARLNGIADTLL